MSNELAHFTYRQEPGEEPEICLFRLENISLTLEDLRGLSIDVPYEIKDHIGPAWLKPGVEYIVTFKRSTENVGDWIVDDWEIQDPVDSELEARIENASYLVDQLYDEIDQIKKCQKQ